MIQQVCTFTALTVRMRLAARKKNIAKGDLHRFCS